MSFRAAENDDAIGLRGEAIHVGHAPFSARPDRASPWWPERSAGGLFIYTQTMQNFGLALRRCAAMAAHGRNNERFAAA